MQSLQVSIVHSLFVSFIYIKITFKRIIVSVAIKINADDFVFPNTF